MRPNDTTDRLVAPLLWAVACELAEADGTEPAEQLLRARHLLADIVTAA